MIKLKKDEARSLPVLMIDSTDHVTPKTGLAFGDTTVQVSKDGGALAPFDDEGKWTERGQGLYFIDFGTGDLNTEGYFTYLVTAADTDQFSGMAYVDDFSDYKADVGSLNDPTAATIADAVWDEALTGATHNVETSAGRRLRQVEDVTIAREETCRAGADNDKVQLDASASAVDDFYLHDLIILTSGTGAGQERHIDGYDGTDKICTLNRDWTTNPAADTKYTIKFDSSKHIHHFDAEAVAQINTEVDNALDTDIPAIPTAGSINAKIDALPSDPADQSSLETFIIAAGAQVEVAVADAHGVTDGIIEDVGEAVTIAAVIVGGLVETLQDDMDDVHADTAIAEKILTGKWTIADNQLIMYDDDGTTPLYTFNLKNAAGAAASTRIFSREPA